MQGKFDKLVEQSSPMRTLGCVDCHEDAHNLALAIMLTMSELGELLDVTNKYLTSVEKLDHEALVEEFGDTLWGVALIQESVFTLTSFNLNDVLDKAIAKQQRRNNG